MERQILDAEADAMTNHPKIKSNSRKPLKWGFFIPKFDLSESCQKKMIKINHRLHKTLVKYGASGRSRTCNLLIRSQKLYPIELRMRPDIVLILHRQ